MQQIQFHIAMRASFWDKLFISRPNTALETHKFLYFQVIKIRDSKGP